VNRNKRSVVIDLKAPDGLALAKALIASAQVVVSSFRPGVMEKLGLGADELLRERPDLVCASFSGFGETGPGAHRRGMDTLAQVESGMAVLGGVIAHVPLIDITAGMGLAQAVIAALFKRERTGMGSKVEGRLFDAGLLLQAPTIAEYSATGSIASAAVKYPVAGLFSASDGEVLIAAYYDWHWKSLCEVIGLSHLVDEPRFASRAARTENAADLRPMLDEAIAKWARTDLIGALDEAGVMVASLRSYDEVFEDPQVAHNQVFIESPIGEGTVKLVRPPYTIDGRPTRFAAPPPETGEHTIDVFRSLGVDDDELERLLKDRVIGTAETGDDH
jgi:formyl-CoA transferase/CoA:oxalate CoA-transferase